MRLDFLQDSEKRYQGPVSGRFLAIATTGTLLAALLMVSAHLFFRHRLTKREIASRRAAMERTRPRVDRVREMQAETGRLRQANTEKAGWGKTRIEWSEALRQLQGATPESVQLLQWDLRDELSAPRRASPAQPFEPRRVFRVRVTGLAEGEQADETVADLIQAMRRFSAGGAPLFQDVKLLSIQADRTAGRPVSRFDLEATGRERPLP